MVSRPLVHRRKLWINDAGISRQAKEEHFEYCTFLSVDLSDFDCEDTFFKYCLFLNCELPSSIHHNCMKDSTIMGCRNNGIPLNSTIERKEDGKKR